MPAPFLDALLQRYAVKTTPHLEHLAAGPEGAAIARQYTPTAAELYDHPEEHPDPIGDDPHSPVPGLVHRYPDRVLLKPVSVCAAYCRFCFRRASVGPQGKTLTPAELDAALDYIRAHPAVFEVILSGGDPLLLAPHRLAALRERLEALPHLGVVRIHTRLPLQDPARITPALAEALASPRLALFIALHINHPAEFTPEVAEALGHLRRGAGASLVVQSVLLRGVNDDVETLEALFRACLRHGLKPYYLHHPDRAPGTDHFHLPIATGQALMRALRGRLSGLALPTYVLDRPGGRGKVPLGPQWNAAEDSHWVDYATGPSMLGCGEDAEGDADQP